LRLCTLVLPEQHLATASFASLWWSRPFRAFLRVDGLFFTTLLQQFTWGRHWLTCSLVTWFDSKRICPSSTYSLTIRPESLVEMLCAPSKQTTVGTVWNSHIAVSVRRTQLVVIGGGVDCGMHPREGLKLRPFSCPINNYLGLPDAQWASCLAPSPLSDYLGA